MKYFSIFAIIFFLCFTTILATEDNVDESDVLVLTDDTFEAAIKEHPNILVEFYAPWCGHCKSLKPNWAKAATELKGKAVLAKVDCTVEKNTATSQQVSGFPTIKFFRNGEASPFTGGRTAEGIVSWISKKLGPAITVLNSAEEVEAFTSAGGAIIVNTEENSVAHTAVNELAQSDALEAWKFGSVSGAVANGLGLGVNEVKIYTKEAGKTLKNTIPETSTELLTWINDEGYSLVEDVSPEVYQRLAKTGKKFALLFDKPENKESSYQFAKTIAEKFKGKFGILWADANVYAQAVKGMGSSGDLLPTLIAVEDPQKQKFIVWDESKALDQNSAETWIQNIIDGKAKTWLKSEPIPTTNDAPVKVIVGKTFDEIVLDKSKDVLVEFYAPWCGHCKNLVPIYDELATKLAGIETVVIAKIDATANAFSGAEVQGFPTIILFPAGDKTNPITFDGERTAAGFAKFLSEKATHKFTLPADLAKESTEHKGGENESDNNDNSDNDNDDDDDDDDHDHDHVKDEL